MPSFPGVLLRNWRLKITAFALAVVLWVTMQLTDDRIDRLNISSVEVRVEHVHRDWYLVQPPSPPAVEMSVTGPLRDILRASMSRPTIEIRVDTVFSEDSVLTLIPDWVTDVDRSSVTIENFRPSSVRLLFDRNQEEEIPVTVRLTGELPDSLALVAEPRANLLFTSVRGAAAVVDALETVFLEPFDLSGVTGSGRFELALDTAGFGGLAVNPARALLNIEVAPVRSRVLALPVEWPGADPELVLASTEVNVTLYGAEALLIGADTAVLRVVVDADAAVVRSDVEEDGEARVPLSLVGIPSWVRGELEVDSVTVRRPGGP
ncbi:MAG: YbbR-like domain-containing protein [Gemmatimonadota bacterium]|nr:YbbR-like domain-containing protein [Gemmatimonadota bacterium]MDE2984405.1 YbbR-like domain-containing protein [Gemmatimonadota bacterium]